MLYRSKRSESTIRVLKSSLMKVVRNQVKVGCLSQDTFFWAGSRSERKIQCHACFGDTDGQPRSHASLLAATVQERNGAAGKDGHYVSLPVPGQGIYGSATGLVRMSEMDEHHYMSVWSALLTRKLIPFFRFAESFHQVLRWENCHCLPKTPCSCFLLLGHVLQFTFYCLRWARARAVKV